VARALQHHRAGAGPRLLPVRLRRLRAEHHRDRHPDRELRLVLHPVPRLHPRPAGRLHRRGQGDHSPPGAGRPRGPLMPAAGVLGVFAHVDTTTHAIRELRARGFQAISTYSPVPLEELEEALTGHGLPKSPVRLFTLVGALTGTATGFWLTIW